MNSIERINDIEKVLYIIDMNNGFVNFGNMANSNYNSLVPEQLRTIEKIRKEKGLVSFILEGHQEDATEFLTYPKHCILGTKEAELIPELIGEQNNPNTRTYYKNSINGMLNSNLQNDIRNLKNLREIIIEGVCADLCVMDFARTLARFLDETNHEAKLFVVKSAIDTFDSPEHDRNKWMWISQEVMKQAGIDVVNNLSELNEREKILKLNR